MVRSGRRFKPADVAQQVVGGFLLAGPFVVTAEVWQLATNMNNIQLALSIGMVFAIGYGALYKAEQRDPDREVDVAGVPIRFISLMAVSFGSVLILALVFDAPATFLTEFNVAPADQPLITVKAVSVGAVFSVVGAATADSVF
jgi:uncharacterized membrane protein